MDQWEVVILSGLLSLIVSIATAWITATIARKNDVRKLILEERSKQYFEIYPLIDELISNIHKVYDEEYMQAFISQKAKMKLLASQKTFRAYSVIFQMVIDAYNAYDIYCGYHQNEKRSCFDDEDYRRVEANLALSEMDFKKYYLPDRNMITEKIQDLYMQMRNDLGSNVK